MSAFRKRGNGLSDCETTDAATFDLRSKAAVGWAVTQTACYDTTLTYWRVPGPPGVLSGLTFGQWLLADAEPAAVIEQKVTLLELRGGEGDPTRVRLLAAGPEHPRRGRLPVTR